MSASIDTYTEKISLQSIAEALVQRYGSENNAAHTIGLSRRSLRRMRGTEQIREVPRQETLEYLANHLAYLDRQGHPLVVDGTAIRLSPDQLFRLGAEQIRSEQTAKDKLLQHVAKLSEEDCEKILNQWCKSMDCNKIGCSDMERLENSLKKSSLDTLRKLVKINLERFAEDTTHEKMQRLITHGTNQQKAIDISSGELVDIAMAFVFDKVNPDFETTCTLFLVFSSALLKADEKGLTNSGFSSVDAMLDFIGVD